MNQPGRIDRMWSGSGRAARPGSSPPALPTTGGGTCHITYGREGEGGGGLVARRDRCEGREEATPQCNRCIMVQQDAK